LILKHFCYGFIGKYFWNNGSMYEGEFEDNLRSGYGKKFNSAGELLEEGLFLKGFFIKKI